MGKSVCLWVWSAGRNPPRRLDKFYKALTEAVLSFLDLDFF